MTHVESEAKKLYEDRLRGGRILGVSFSQTSGHHELFEQFDKVRRRRRRGGCRRGRRVLPPRRPGHCRALFFV